MPFTGEQHQFESYEAALEYLKERGTPKYWGWEGQTKGYYVYTFEAKNGERFHLAVYDNGLVRIRT